MVRCSYTLRSRPLPNAAVSSSMLVRRSTNSFPRRAASLSLYRTPSRRTPTYMPPIMPGSVSERPQSLYGATLLALPASATSSMGPCELARLSRCEHAGWGELLGWAADGVLCPPLESI